MVAKQAIATGVRLESAPRPLTDLFDATVLKHPDQAAIDFMGRVTSYAELAEAVRHAAAGLQELGVGAGTRVALCMPNMPHYPILFLATLRLGGTVVNVNPLYVERELHHLLEDSGAQVIATCDLTDVHARVSAVAAELGVQHVITCPIAEGLPTLQRIAYRLFRRKDIAPTPHGPQHISYHDLVARRGEPAPVAVSPDAVAVLQYTGGTTGLPKAAMLTHANLVANADAMVVHVGGESATQDRVLGVLPLFHVFALTTVLSFSIRVGAQMILMPRFRLEDTLKTIARTRPTFFPAVPTIYGAIADVAATRTVDLSDIRACISGGAPLPAEVHDAFTRTTRARLVEGYGLSEASPIITCNPIDGPARAGSAGVPFPGTTIEIRDLADPARICPEGERGEICARGPQVMKGYWGRDDETRKVFVDGALRTGDVGYLDAQGYLFIVDRIKDVIISSGYNVYPRVIEDALYEHPAVAEAVVIGVEDQYRGQSPKGFVTLKPGATATGEELRAFLADKVSKIELPHEIEIRDALPKTLIGKLSKKELVEESKRRGPAFGGGGGK